MTDISVIKMIISGAVWRVYSSLVNGRLRAWERLSHSGMFSARLSMGDFRSKLEIISFLSGYMSVRSVFFCFPRFWKSWCQTFKLWSFWSRRCLGGLFENFTFNGHFLRTPTTTTSIFLKISFLFSKAELVLLAWQLRRSPGWASTFLMVQRKLEWKLDFQALARSSAEEPSIILAIGTSRVRGSMVQKRKQKHNEVSVWLCEGSTLHLLQTSEFWWACFRDPVSLPFHASLFLCTWITVSGRSGCRARKAKKSSHPWHFPCWSLRHNELECTNLVHWTWALHRFWARDAIIVVGSVLEKHFEGDFTPDQEKEITFKRWPPGYQSWKLCLVLNGLIRKSRRMTSSMVFKLTHSVAVNSPIAHYIIP